MKDYSNVGAVCDDCAKMAGFTPKDKACGLWVGECDICHEKKWCNNLWHDWDPPKAKAKKDWIDPEDKRIAR